MVGGIEEVIAESLQEEPHQQRQDEDEDRDEDQKMRVLKVAAVSSIFAEDDNKMEATCLTLCKMLRMTPYCHA